MNMDRTQHGGTRLTDPLTAAGEPSPGVPEPITKHSGRFLPSTRYRHPGDVIRLTGSGLVLTGMLAALAVAPGRLTGSGAAAVTWLGADPAGRLLTGLVQVAFAGAAAAVVAATLRHRRFRLLSGLAAGAAAAGAALAGILSLAGDKYPHPVTAAAGHSWLASAAFPGPALLRPGNTPHGDGLLAGLGCELDGAGFPVVDAAGRTSVSGVWAAGNLADPRAQVVTSAGAGSAAAIAINADLVQQDAERAVDDLGNGDGAFSAAMMRDECPPFRLEADGTDPGHLSALPAGPPALHAPSRAPAAGSSRS